MKKLFSILMLVLLASITMAQSISKTINVATAGALSSLLTTTEKTTSTDLVVTGNIDARDVKCMRDEMTKLTNLDMSGVSIQAYTGSDGTSPNGSLTYPANEMPAYSFYNNIYGDKTLTNIKLPTSLTSIGEYAFRQCYRLTGSLTIPNSVTTIGGYAFQNCFSLTGSLIIPGAVTFIGDNAFSGTGFIVINSLCVTPPSLKSTSFSLPLIVYVPSLGLAAYKAAYLWRDYTIVAEKKVIINNPTAGSLAATLIGAGYGPLSSITHLAVTGNLNGVDIAQMKTNMTQLSDIDLTGATLENNILPANAFAEKAVLSYVKLPSSLTIIGSRAFSGCTGLSGELPITPLISSIGDSAFYNCRSLSGGVTLSNGITSIGSYAFYNCNNLHGSLSISNSVKSIGNYAFYRCGLTGSLNIPSFVTSIGDNAFYGCASFTGDLTLSNSLLTIGDLAVCGCYGFSGAISFPSTVTSIGNYAFSGCTTLTELNFSKNTSSINDYAFNNCTGVTKITVPRT
ncbi:MAG: leucine-rich repeat domain-containing protein, partial [Bacteroidota bacterium]|nr:leucine-rich repeat domain-containing protein [Bacteroidota bacterium]